MDSSLWSNLPRDLVHAVLKIDGRVQHKNGTYRDINRIQSGDKRYALLRPIVLKKTDILRSEVEYDVQRNGFYFQFSFEGDKELSLSYDYHFSYANQFEICYADFHDGGWKQTRTYM